ncbi:MAG: hypothetical protein K2Q17_00060 [Nitrospiraceae bacterium]|jgi:hypothetical protein|uniref:hypothetical protein n=1 Tax=Nitrospira cf. moscoviensis SBR1015 TaxID=96242 RepID=UPI000A09C949|nr:hypothetical protein [Nitrospira cf. moscoviensis SBR1015]MBY0246028.1 hypothetical protein [Nitrospiraceae bacterium]OQW34039.1 MAG: hypothetical protein A4E20_18210 [Nitrospira sp. SG-bin2]
MNSIISGPGSERAEALRHGCRLVRRTFNSGIQQERYRLPLGLGPKVKHWDIVDGDVVSVEDGRFVPFSPALGFGGIVEGIGDDFGRYVASVKTRGAVSCQVHGSGALVREGSKVFVRRDGDTTVFTVEEAGGALAGEILAIEDLSRSFAIVGFRLVDDVRPFDLRGPRPR